MAPESIKVVVVKEVKGKAVLHNYSAPKMDDSDEYVFDDIILDEQTLATLDKQERNFLGENSHTTSTSASEPVNKRFKTNNGWTPGPGGNISLGVDDDEMPEISLKHDGSYGVGTPVNALTVSLSKLAARKSERSVPPNNYSGTFDHLDFSRGLTLPQNMLSGGSTSRQPLYASNRQKHTLNSGNFGTTSFHRSEPTVNNDGASTYNLPDQMLELQKKLDEVGIRLTFLYVLGVLKYIPNIMSSCAKKTPRYK